MEIIVIQHRSAGNEQVGSMWHDAKSFDENTTLKEVREAFYLYDEDLIIPMQSKKQK